MDREPPRTTSDEIDLYIRTYYSLLRSSGEVRVRAFEEAHSYSNSTLHPGVRDPAPDVAAFAYAAARLPEEMPWITRVVLGQSHEHFEGAGLDVQEWPRVRTRGRRRPLRCDGKGTLAAFITSTSDIDDLVPILTAYQIEWNKLHELLARSAVGRALATETSAAGELPVHGLAAALGIDEEGIRRLQAALGARWREGIAVIARRESDLSMRLLAGSFAQYQRAAQRWWSGIEPCYVRDERPRRRPIYFVSSNMHCLANLLGGYARSRRDDLVAYARAKNPEGLAPLVDEAIATKDDAELANLLHYLLGGWLHDADTDARVADVRRADGAVGIETIASPGHVDVDAQLIALSGLDPARLDPRVRVPGIAKLAESDAVILNIDYPLGFAAYHHLSRVAQGVGDLRGIYVMGKAATLNARVGDVLISSVGHDEHSRNTFLYRNCFAAADVQPWVKRATVLDNQKALTVRSAFLQNRDYMGVFYREGYTVLEMELGPFLSAIHEMVSPQRHPVDELVQLSTLAPFDLGILHYASDTPYSRRQSLLSKSLSYFGVESTYACAIAIVRRILAREVARATAGET